MLTYHKTCAQMSVFIVNTIGMFIKFIDIISTLVREFLNIVWSIGLLLSYVYHQKLFIFGFSFGYILSKIAEFYIHWALRGPFTVIGYYAMMRTLNVFRKDWMKEYDPLLNAGEEEMERIMRALRHLGIVPRDTHLTGGMELKNIEFYTEWNNFVKRTEDERLRVEFIETIDKEEDSEIDEDEESEEEEESVEEEEESDEEEELVECDCCGEKDIDPNDLDDSEKNLGDIGGGYAHEHCMSDEQTKEYETALRGDENEEMDEELDIVNKDDENEEMDEEEEPIKRGWFNWEKGEQSRKTV